MNWGPQMQLKEARQEIEAQRALIGRLAQEVKALRDEIRQLNRRIREHSQDVNAQDHVMPCGCAFRNGDVVWRCNTHGSN